MVSSGSSSRRGKIFRGWGLEVNVSKAKTLPVASNYIPHPFQAPQITFWGGLSPKRDPTVGTAFGVLIWVGGQRFSRCFVEQQNTGELTNGGGVCSGDEEDCNEELGDEHGNTGGGGVSPGWLTFSKESSSRFYTCSPVSCEHEKPQVTSAYHILPGLPFLLPLSCATCSPSLPLRSLRCSIPYILTSLGIQSPIASSIIRGPSLMLVLASTCLYCSMISEASWVTSVSVSVGGTSPEGTHRMLEVIPITHLSART